MAWYDDLLSPFETTTEDEKGNVTSTGDYDWGKIIGAGTGALTAGVQIADLLGYDVGGSQQQPAGYQGGIPSYTVARQQVPGTYDPDRRPGSGGQRYFTDVRYDGGDTSAEAAGLAALNRANMASRDRAGQAMPEVYAARQAAAQGGIQQLAEGGFVRDTSGIFQNLANPSSFTSSGANTTGIANTIANNAGGAFDYTTPPPAATTPPPTPVATTPMPPPAATTPLPTATTPSPTPVATTPMPPPATTIGPDGATPMPPSLIARLPGGGTYDDNPAANPDITLPDFPPRDLELPANLVDPNLPNTIVDPNGGFTPAVNNNPGYLTDADGNTVSIDDIMGPDASRPNPTPIKPIDSSIGSITTPPISGGPSVLGPDNINPNAKPDTGPLDPYRDPNYKPDTGPVDPYRDPMSNPDWMRRFGFTTPENFNEIVRESKPQKLRYNPNITKMVNGRLYAQGVDADGNPQSDNYLDVGYADERRKAFDDEQRAQYQEYTNALGPNFTQGQLQRYKAQKFIEKQKDTYKDKDIDTGFFDSEEYQKYLAGPQMGTMDVAFSPYFGQQGSGSMSGRQDAAYEDYLRRTGQVGKISPQKTEKEMIDAGLIGMLPTDGVDMGVQMPPGFRALPPGELGFTEDIGPLQAYAGGSATFDESAPYKFAQGGTIGFKEGRYLDGATDGMADEKPAVIDGEEPALLSDGEFVIPADVVSHLGNGNSDAGAKVLEQMMAEVRKARTGSEEQGKEINPEEFLPV
jgi:hypothetical protein